ncbi:C-type lectin domain family 2 member L-like isoform X1 [Cyanistes caeruleus]|uniref:C-type lectin domain family 5 member A-like n=1 Tax=Cyanistes caeruleus TaxID=156563 RepID=A0A8C0TZZ8_CYACU|nr:C-type lectin domain family 2 member L-like isoform X1 [Cyanistes caeruleus]
MAEYVLYADLNLPQSTRPRIPTVPDVQDSDCTYAEVKVKSQDTNAAADCKSSGKSCCSRKHAAILVVIILILVLAVYLIITYGPTAGSQNSSTTLSHIREEELGCPPLWRKHGRKCYFFSPEKKMKDWEASRGECTTMESDLVVIDSREEMSYLLSVSKYDYYLLGLKYFEKKKEWKWINNMKHDPTICWNVPPWIKWALLKGQGKTSSLGSTGPQLELSAGSRGSSCAPERWDGEATLGPLWNCTNPIKPKKPQEDSGLRSNYGLQGNPQGQEFD